MFTMLRKKKKAKEPCGCGAPERKGILERYLHKPTFVEKIKRARCKHESVELLTCEPVTFLPKTAFCKKCDKYLVMKNEWV